jgi:alpha-amylase
MQLRFKLGKAESKHGQNVYVVGNRSCIGAWDPKKAHKLSTRKDIYPAWESKVNIDVNDVNELEYKYIFKND